MQETDGNIIAPQGFKVKTVSCGINTPKGTRKDLVIITSDTPASAAGVFTTNKVQASPVLLSKRHIRNGTAQAMVINSGNANACNGDPGMKDAQTMSDTVANGLDIPSSQVLVASTGVIGHAMPMACITSGIQEAIDDIDSGNDKDAAEAIMTTDTVPKSYGVKFNIGDTEVAIGGIAKGSGMICPDMATMIGVLTTDVAIGPGPLKAALKQAVNRSFNCITVDGDMSTNDTVFIMANCAADHPVITSTSSPGYEAFETALLHVCTILAKKIARDGEGATKFVEIQVNGARTNEDAQSIGRTVANSALVKTAIYGNDPNWGRILCAIGYADADADPDLIDLHLCSHQLTHNGQGISIDEPLMRKELNAEYIPVVIDLKLGDGTATIWTCDMSHEYVTINAEYTT